MGQVTRNYGMVRSLDELKTLIEKLASHDGPIGYDIESGYNGPDKAKGALMPKSGAFTVGFSITDNPNYARYIPLRHDSGPNLDPDDVWPLMKPLLEQKRIVPHHAKFEAKFAREVDINLGVLADTMLDAYILSEWRSFGLKDLVYELFGHQMMKIETLFPGYTEKQLKCLRFNKLDLTTEVTTYACEDASWTLATHEKLDARARRERGEMWKIEHLISELMVDVESWGIMADWDALARERARIEPFLMKWEQQVKSQLGEMVGRNVGHMNLGSPKQLGELLYGEIGLTTTVMTKGSDKTPPKMSTNAIALEGLSKQYPAIKSLVQFRELQNLQGRLVNWLQEKPGSIPVRGRDDRTHASYNQVVVGTGRFAAGDPAIQQLPKKYKWELATGEEFKGNFRDFIVAAPDHYFLGYDYSQIELRILAGLSQEPALIKAFENDEDVHTLTAAMMLGKHPDEVDEETERPVGKTMNFALMYQMGPQSLSERLAITKERAKELYAAYFDQFTSVAAWMEKVQQQGRMNGYTESCFGRKYTVWELQSEVKAIRSKAERVFVNAPVQGAAADYMKIAMIRAKIALSKADLWGRVKMVANLHDALTFEVPNDLNPADVRAILEPAVVFPRKDFPKIVADWEVGQTWGSSAKWKDGLVPKFDGQHWVLVGAAEASADDEDDFDPEALFGEADEEGSIGPVALPKVDFNAIPLAKPDLRVVEPPSTPNPVQGEARTLIVELTDMPDMAQFDRLLALFTTNPGPNPVTLRTPEGEVELDLSGTSLGATDQARISLAAGGARAFFAAEDVSVDEVFSGLAL